MQQQAQCTHADTDAGTTGAHTLSKGVPHTAQASAAVPLLPRPPSRLEREGGMLGVKPTHTQQQGPRSPGSRRITTGYLPVVLPQASVRIRRVRDVRAALVGAVEQVDVVRRGHESRVVVLVAASSSISASSSLSASSLLHSSLPWAWRASRARNVSGAGSAANLRLLCS